MVENGTQVDKMDNYGNTALTGFGYFRSEAEQETQIQIIELLRSKGAKLDHVLLI